MVVPTKTIDQLLPDLRQDYGADFIKDVETTKKWGSEEVKKLITSQQVDKYVVIMNIENGEGYLPDNYQRILQAGWGFVDNPDCKRQAILRYMSHEKIDGCKIEVNVKCTKCKQEDCNCLMPILIYEVNQTDIQTNPQWMAGINKGYLGHAKLGGASNPYMTPGFTLMHPSLSNFADKRNLNGCTPLHTEKGVVYTIEEDKLIVHTIKKCRVALSYLGYKMDGNGMLRVPDIPEVWATLKYAVAMKIVFGRMLRDRDPRDERMHSYINGLYKDEFRIAKIKLGRLDPEKFVAIWSNNFGKQIPHYYGEETFYQEINDTYRRYQ